MKNFKFETIEVEDGIIAIFCYENKKVTFMIDEFDLEKIIEEIFLKMPFDEQKIIIEGDIECRVDLKK